MSHLLAQLDREEREESTAELERIVFFSDAVFAIAITLLALEIKIPDPTPDQMQDVTGMVVGLGPKVLGYIISFLVVGRYWVGHHQSFRHIKRYDMPFLWINLLFLMLIAFVPVVSALVGWYPGQKATAVAYSGALAVTGLLEVVLWSYATRGHRLVAAHLDADIIFHQMLRAVIPLAIFALATGIAFVQPGLAPYLWFLAVVLPVVAGRALYHRAA